MSGTAVPVVLVVVLLYQEDAEGTRRINKKPCELKAGVFSTWYSSSSSLLVRRIPRFGRFGKNKVGAVGVLVLFKRHAPCNNLHLAIAMQLATNIPGATSSIGSRNGLGARAHIHISSLGIV